MVIGHSMGVNVAIELSLRENSNVHGLVLISGSPHSLKILCLTPT